MTKHSNIPKTIKPASKETRWRKIPTLTNRELLEELYLTKGTLNAIAEHANCTRYQVYRAVKEHGIDIRKLNLKRDCRQQRGENRMPEKHIMEFSLKNEHP